MKKSEDFSVLGDLWKFGIAAQVQKESKQTNKQTKKLISLLGLTQLGYFIASPSAYVSLHHSPNQHEGQSPSNSFNPGRQIKHIGNTPFRRVS